MTRYDLVVNARPDATGKIWAMLQDVNGEPYAGHLGRWLENRGIAAEMRDRIFVGCAATDPTIIIRTAAATIGGRPDAARFDHADDSAHAGTGPVLYFHIYTKETEQ